ncbi:Uncharacterised protein [Peptostreptococcus anaerobius]|uniref:Uncharacterized protein n=2 Tax=Peptostreptococcus anaerobius TaxID=1261 RepID=D3MQP9_9FIRM|nr:MULTISPECIES: hypothetical protein [Peptostreptococcus]EFD05464.1 hypothetical protein HMPREF0631_0116 [Peptostreptococcus anaerobius 653-L]MBS5596708.1 hypothetical protein [Peptostreptococcus sp.]MCB6982578.1 hypothetical protein [Peptostreptococcus anaerobius]MCQ5150635.1 hypothetical protein [Peptostreptococcus anaerobius]MDB8851664.1 hypothetical protein [Peptostreptococcus anaerobius]
MLENIGNEFEVFDYNMKGYRIGTFVFNYRLVEEDADTHVEIDVYKYSDPVVLYIKTYQAPLLDGAGPVDMCEALYEEFYEKSEDSSEEK